MNTKIRKFGSTEDFETVDHRETECPFCEHARQRGINFREDVLYREAEAILFLENDAGVVHRIAASKVACVIVLSGKDVTPEQARAEIEAHSGK